MGTQKMKGCILSLQCRAPKPKEIVLALGAPWQLGHIFLVLKNTQLSSNCCVTNCSKT